MFERIANWCIYVCVLFNEKGSIEPYEYVKCLTEDLSSSSQAEDYDDAFMQFLIELNTDH